MTRSDWSRERERALPFALALLVGCGVSGADGEHDVAGRVERVVYGNDDRVEAFEELDATLRDHATRSTAAIVRADEIAARADGGVELLRESLEQIAGVCERERFADQPSPALCTAVLVGDDLVLTAGHCAALLSCPKLAFVFGYHYAAPNRLRTLDARDVYYCAEVVTARASDPAGSEVVDYAWIRLDRPAGQELLPIDVMAPHAPVAVGAQVIAIGHSTGGPVKVARGGTVLDARASTQDYFTATLDNARGGSGSGVFDDEGMLLGVAVRGQRDFVPTGAGCLAMQRLPDAVGPSEAESVTYVAAALEGLCRERPDAAHALCSAAGHGGETQHGCSVSRTGQRDAWTMPWWALSALAAARRAHQRRATAPLGMKSRA